MKNTNRSIQSSSRQSASNQSTTSPLLIVFVVVVIFVIFAVVGSLLVWILYKQLKSKSSHHSTEVMFILNSGVYRFDENVMTRKEIEERLSLTWQSRLATADEIQSAARAGSWVTRNNSPVTGWFASTPSSMLPPGLLTVVSSIVSGRISKVLDVYLDSNVPRDRLTLQQIIPNSARTRSGDNVDRFWVYGVRPSNESVVVSSSVLPWITQDSVVDQSQWSQNS